MMEKGLPLFPRLLRGNGGADDDRARDSPTNFADTSTAHGGADGDSAVHATATRRAAAAALRALTGDVEQHPAVLAHNVPAELAELLQHGDAFARRESADLLRALAGASRELSRHVAEAINAPSGTPLAELKEQLARLALGDDSVELASPSRCR